jgi:tetratricopeptide (TPR) repeat protein
MEGVMKRWVWFVAFAFLLVPAASSAQGKKDKDKDKEKEQAKKSGPVTAADLMKEAEAKEAAGDLEGAASLLKKASVDDPTALLRLGHVREKGYELDVAMDDYKAAAEKLTGAQKGEALGRLAVLQNVRGLAAESTASAEAAVAADAAGVWPTIALARARALQGKGDEAVELAKKAEAAGGGAAASAALGRAQEARGDLVAAEAAYRSALAVEDGAVAQTLGLARVLRKTNRAADAEPLLQKVIATAPGAIEAYKESARVKMALNRPQEAFGDAATAAAMAENDVEAQKLVLEVTVARSLDAVRTGQIDMAIQDLTALRDKEPNQAEIRVGLAKALVAKRQADPALVELQKAVELDPANAEAQYQLGFVQHVMKGNAAGALGSYEKAVAADPANTTYRTNLGAVLSEVKQTDRAVAELKKVVETPGYSRPEAWIYLGQAHIAAKRFKEALEALNKAAEIAPNNAQVEAYLGWSYFGLMDAPNFKLHAGKAKALGYQEATLLAYLKRIEGGEAIK